MYYTEHLWPTFKEYVKLKATGQWIVFGDRTAGEWLGHERSSDPKMPCFLCLRRYNVQIAKNPKTDSSQTTNLPVYTF